MSPSEPIRRQKPVKTGKGRYRRISALLAAVVAASLVAVNIGAERLEKKYGWRTDLSFNSISTHSAVTKDTLDNLQHPVQRPVPQG